MAKDNNLRKILAESIRDIETGASDIEDCLKRHADRVAELRPHLQLWSGLNASAKAQPNFAAQQRGQQLLLAALSDMEASGERRMIPFLTPALVKAAVAVAGVALLVAGAAGASAAFGGPDVAGEVLTVVGLSDGPDENANPNAVERCLNATEGRANANDNAANADDHPNARAGEGGGANGQPNENANPRSGDRCLNADTAGNGADGPSENANPNAADGADNADHRDGNANPNAADGADNADHRDGNANGAADRVPDDVPSDSVP